ncbi:hypothetical protein KKB83_00805, partial [Patescibacteria group bacterium]|nr:hypothetical protein [Patescibacteria group bacterium]
MFNRFRSFLKQPIALFCGLGYFAVVFLSFTSALPSLTLSPSWSEFYDFENSAGKVYDIQVSPSDVAALYVYVDRGLYKSIDYGQNFTNIFTTVHDARLLVIDNF